MDSGQLSVDYVVPTYCTQSLAHGYAHGPVQMKTYIHDKTRDEKCHANVSEVKRFKIILKIQQTFTLLSMMVASHNCHFTIAFSSKSPLSAIFRMLQQVMTCRCITDEHRWALSPISVISDIGLSLISERPISE